MMNVLHITEVYYVYKSNTIPFVVSWYRNEQFSDFAIINKYSVLNTADQPTQSKFLLWATSWTNPRDHHVFSLPTGLYICLAGLVFTPQMEIAVGF
jgi:hypothetical protein